MLRTSFHSKNATMGQEHGAHNNGEDVESNTARAVKGKRSRQQYHTQCKYIIPLLHLSSREKSGKIANLK